MINRILSRYEGRIMNSQDLLGGDKPSALFYLLAPALCGLLDTDPAIIHKNAIRWRRIIHPVLSALGALTLKNTQIIEDRPLLYGGKTNIEPFSLPDDPIIFVANHAFKDDVKRTFRIECLKEMNLFVSIHFMSCVVKYPIK